MNSLFNVFVLSMLPLGELRAGIPFGILSGLGILPTFFLAVFANFLVAFILFFFLDHLHTTFMKIKIYERLFVSYIGRIQKKHHHLQNHKWPYYALFIFVAIPFPLTGVYSGTLLSWLFKFNRKHSYFSLGLGVVAAGIITTLFTVGVRSLF